MQEAPCDYSKGNRFEGGAPADNPQQAQAMPSQGGSAD